MVILKRSIRSAAGKIGTERAATKSAGEITWNFEKFLFDRGGRMVARFQPKTAPESEEIVRAVETFLAKRAED